MAVSPWNGRRGAAPGAFRAGGALLGEALRPYGAGAPAGIRAATGSRVGLTPDPRVSTAGTRLPGSAPGHVGCRLVLGA
ncbi:hypothetical protein SLI_2686 [Streptomyces lividans 1326]|uniref:Uncharacterized protein n=1 Tax=Streptomyces lividans 1326 TaxID=1200984 RepID=A0A7U9DNU8_STRLI|nr:hypothetical protein SLI_2686 [Streptomyces lividans 1326]